MKPEIKEWYERPIGIMFLNIVTGLVVTIVCALIV